MLQPDHLRLGVLGEEEQEQVVPEMPGEQGVVADVLPAVLAEPLGVGGVLEEPADPVPGPLDRVNEDPRVAVEDLEGDAPDGAR